jgi:hypothetical protein
LQPPDLTPVVLEVLENCQGMDIVIGTHTRRNPPDTVLKLDLLTDKYTAVQNYTTASPVYAFVTEWCRNLSDETPDVQAVRRGYDLLFGLLESHAAPLADPLSALRHDFENLWSPICTDAAGWIESSYSRDYFAAIVSRSAGKRQRLLERSRQLLYAGNKGILRSVEINLQKLPAAKFDEMNRRVAAVRDLLPEVDDSGGPEFANAMTLVGAFERNDYDIARLKAPSFLEWKRALQEALDPLVDSLRMPD